MLGELEMTHPVVQQGSSDGSEGVYTTWYRINQPPDFHSKDMVRKLV